MQASQGYWISEKTRKYRMRPGEKLMAKAGLILIFVMGSLVAYVIFNYEEIRQEQVYRTIQHLNAR